MTARTVLVTDGEQRSALAIVRSLGRAGHRVIVASRSGRSLAGASRWADADVRVADPLRAPGELVEELEHLTVRHDVDVLLPVTEPTLLAVLPERHRFTRARIPFVEADAFRRVTDKAAVLAAAPRFGIAVPEQAVLHDRAAAAALDAEALRYPLVAKPSRSVRERPDGNAKLDVRHAARAAELRALLGELPDAGFPLLLQQRVLGPGMGVFLLLWGGRVVASFAHRRLREKPPAGGVSVLAESVLADPSLLERSAALLRAFDWQGVAMVEYKLDAATGTPVLMEINGRFWGSLQLAIDAGVDFPVLLVALACGDRLPSVTRYREGVRTRWWWGDVDQLLTRLRRPRAVLALPEDAPGRLDALREFVRTSFQPVHNEVLRLDDLRPAARETLDWLRGR